LELGPEIQGDPSGKADYKALETDSSEEVDLRKGEPRNHAIK
jgi:hypothetical protein